MRIAPALCALACLSLLSPAHARTPEPEVVLTPAGPWQVDFGDNRCRMGREMKAGDSKALFLMEQWSPGPVVTWNVVGTSLGRFTSRHVVKYAFANGAEGSFWFVPSTFGKLGASISTSSLLVSEQSRPIGRTLDPAAAAAIDGVSLTQDRKTVTVKFGPLEQPLKVFDQCMDSLVESWGLDPVQQKALSARVVLTNRADVFEKVQAKYPGTATSAGAQADFRILLIIEPDGSISKCALDNQTLAEDFGTVTGPCRAFQKYAKFEPARDANGSPVRSYYSTRILYRIMVL